MFLLQSHYPQSAAESLLTPPGAFCPADEEIERRSEHTTTAPI
jgi:hypothetical protein